MCDLCVALGFKIMEGLDIDVYFQNGQRGIMCNVELGYCEWFGSIYGYFQNWLGGVIV